MKAVPPSRAPPAQLLGTGLGPGAGPAEGQKRRKETVTVAVHPCSRKKNGEKM